jgi:hypothetical protein
LLLRMMRVSSASLETVPDRANDVIKPLGGLYFRFEIEASKLADRGKVTCRESRQKMRFSAQRFPDVFHQRNRRKQRD